MPTSIKQSFATLVNSQKPSQLVLGIFFILYILLNVETPALFATHIDTLYGKILIVILAAIIFMKTNPVIGILGLIVAYQIIKTSTITTGTYAMQHYLPSEEIKMADMEKFNQEKGSLEEEMVDRMAPLVIHDGDSNLDYKPILDDQHDAALLEYSEL
jgi:hypothetical protein